MRRSLVTAALLTAALAGCGPTDADTAAPAATNAARASSPAPAVSSASTGKVTPEQLCGMLSVAKVSEISGITIKTAIPSWSANVAVCTYKGTDGFSKLITEFSPDSKTMFDMTKAKGEAVRGIGKEAVYFDTAGQLSVRLNDVDLFICYVTDTRMHHNNPKAGSIEVAKVVVPHLPGA